MTAHWLLGMGLVTVLGAVPTAEGVAPDLAGYEAARASAGRDAGAQVKLALWCEAHGLSAERVKHLSTAVLVDPRNAAARGLLGLVEYAGRWQRPDAVAEKVKADDALTGKLAEYNARRARTRDNADDHARLALWCEQNGLKPEAVAHLTAVTRLDPGNESAWKKLGYRKHGHRWVTDAQLAAEKADADAQRKADKHWRPLLTRLKGRIGDERHAAEVDAALAGVTDPRAVPSVWAVLATDSDPAVQSRAVEVLGRIDAPGASRALAALAVFARPAEVRRAAAETLTRRDRREYLDQVIAALRDPIKYQVKPVGGPGSPGALFVEGKRFNVQRLYNPPPAYNGPLPANAQVSYDQNGLPVLNGVAGYVKYRESGASLAASGLVPAPQWAPSPEFRAMASSLSGGSLGPEGRRLGHLLTQTRQNAAKNTSQMPQVDTASSYIVTRQENYQIPIGEIMLEAQRGAAVAQQQLQNDVDAVESYNNATREANALILAVLKGTTGQDLGESQESWSRWWTNEQGYAFVSNSDPKPTVTETFSVGYSPQAAPQILDGPIVGAQRQHSCFAAGTPVRTLTGLRPIESIQAGDRVLTQDGATGLLTYQPVLAVFHNPPNQTLRVTLGGDPVVATGIHRFWKSGQGWVMARDLKPGDSVRTLGGLRTVDAVVADRTQPVFNLQVAHGQSFFAGAPGALVHDNSVVDPVSHPFDAEPTLTAVASATR